MLKASALKLLAIFIFAGATLATVRVALADNFDIVTGVPGPVNIEQTGLLGFIQNGYLLALGLAGLLAVGSITYGAIEYTLSRGNAAKLSDAWDRIIQALIGILLLVGAGTILTVINPGLLSLELPQLQQVESTPFSADPIGSQTTPGDNPSQNPIPTSPTPTNEQAQAGEVKRCYPASARQLKCVGRWVDNAQSCTPQANSLCIYNDSGSTAAACKRICTQGSTWHGLLSADGKNCVCELPPVVIDTQANRLHTCQDEATRQQFKCVSGGYFVNSPECPATAPNLCYYPEKHDCYRTCGGLWLGLLKKTDNSCACP